jgi:cytochrome c5
MRLHSKNPGKSGHGLRALLIAAVFAAVPLLAACGKSGPGNGGEAAKAPSKSESSGSGSGGMGGGMSNGKSGNGGMMGDHMNGGGMMGDHMNGGTSSTQGSAADTTQQAAGSGENATKVAENSSSSGSSGGAQKEQKRPPMDGSTVYHRFCVLCHKTGMNGAPKYGNKQAWAPRIAQGKEALYHAAIHGLRAMPAKGGISGLYDSEVKDAVNYMVNAVGGWKDNSKSD